MKRRIISLILTLIMVISMLPLSSMMTVALNAPVVTLTVPESIILKDGQIPEGEQIVFTTDRDVSDVNINCAGGVSLELVSDDENTYIWQTISSALDAGADCLTYEVTYGYAGNNYTKKAYSILKSNSEANVADTDRVKYKYSSSKIYYAHVDTVIKLDNSIGGTTYSFGSTATVKESNDYDIAGMSEEYAPLGTYYVDRSLYSDLSEIPGMSLTFTHFLLDYSETRNNNYGTGIFAQPQFSGDDVFSLYSDNESNIIGEDNYAISKTYYFKGDIPVNTTRTTIYTVLYAKTKNEVTVLSPVYIKVAIVPYDKGSLRTLVNSENILNRQGFDYAEGWEEYEAAYKQAYITLINPVTSQEEINSVKEDLENAISVLKQNGIYCDYTAVEEAIANAESISKSNFNDYAPVQAAIDAVNWELENNPTNTVTVAQYAQDIKDAVRANLKEADYSAVYEAISGIPADIDAKYTATCPQHAHTTEVYYYDAEKRDAVKNAVDEIDWTKKLDEQETIEGYATAINNAVRALKEGKANYKYVEEMNHPDYGREYYTDESLAAYDAAVGAIETDKNLLAHDQATVNEYAVKYYNAKSLLKTNALNYPGDYSKIEIAIKKVPENYEKIFTQETVAVLKNAISAVDYSLSSAEQEIIDNYEKAILDAIIGLEVGLGDFSGVEKAIEEARKLNPENYYDFTFVTAAINAVDYTRKANEQEIIDGYETEIRNAIAALIAKPADYTKVEKAKAKIPETLGMYTTDSVENLKAVLASTPSNLTVLEQDKVDTYARNILRAVELLVPSAIATYSIETDKTEASRGEEVTVTCKLNTTYNMGMSQFVVFYDRTQFEVVGEGKEAVTVCSELTANGSVSASTQSPEQQYPTTFTPEQKTQYAMVIVRFSPYATATALPKFTETKEIFTFKLKVRDDITENTSAKVFMSNETLGKNVYCYYKDTEVAAESATKTSGMIYELGNADVNVGIKYTQKEEPADYTKVNEAIDTIPENMADIYTEESVTRVRNAVNAVNWELKTADQATVDGYARAIEEAVKALEEKPKTAEYTELKEIVEKYEGYDLSAVSENLTVKGIKDEIDTAISEINWTLSENEQNTVDGYVADIKAKIGRLVEAISEIDVIKAVEELAVIDTENKFISGYEQGTDETAIDESVTTQKGITKKIVSTVNGTGTGTKVEAYLGEELITEYAVVIYGDLNGDGWIDASDVRVMKAIIKGSSPYAKGTANYEAADVDHNGAVNDDDLTLLNSAVKFGAAISQKKDA